MLTYDKMFKVLDSKGVEKVEVFFSGGNDSGSIDKFVLHVYGEEKEVEDSDINKIHPDLSKVLESVVYNDYGSFAGDYDVDGKYVFSVKERTVQKICVESTRQYSEIDQTVIDEDAIQFQKDQILERPTIPESWERTEFKDVKQDQFNYGKSLVVCKTCNKPRSLNSLSVEKVYCGNDCDKVYPASNFYYLDKLNYNFDDDVTWDTNIDSADALKLYMRKYEIR